MFVYKANQKPRNERTGNRLGRDVTSQSIQGDRALITLTS